MSPSSYPYRIIIIPFRASRKLLQPHRIRTMGARNFQTRTDIRQVRHDEEV